MAADSVAMDRGESGVMNRLRLLAGAAARATPQFRGKTRLTAVCDRALRSVARLPDPIAVVADGAHFLITTSDINDFKVMYGVDRSVTDFLVRWAGAREVVIWDVGANVGGVALRVAARCRRARVVAIEASPAVGVRLERNIMLNPDLRSRIACLYGALTEKTGEALFCESHERSNSGIGRLATADAAVADRCSISAWSGDDLIARGLAAAPHIIKVDVEGFEDLVLRGLTDHLQTTRCPVVFEHEPYRLESAGNPPSPVPWLRDLGYSISILRNGGTLTGLPAGLPDWSCDLVALPAAENERGRWS